MHDKREWVLVQLGCQHKLGSQHKGVEQPVRSVFPDYLSVSCDYGLNESTNFQKKAATIFLVTVY